MGDLGVRPDVIEKCLNHVEPNRIKRIYQRQTLRPEMREAWKVLGEYLELLIAAGSNGLLGKFGKAWIGSEAGGGRYIDDADVM